MAYQKYKDIPNRREPLGGRDHIQHIETGLAAAYEEGLGGIKPEDGVFGVGVRRIIASTDPDHPLEDGDLLVLIETDSLFTDFSTDTVGAAPEGWSEPWTAAGAAVVDDGGNKIVRYTSAADARRLLRWDTVPVTGTGTDTTEIVWKWRTTNGLSGVCGAFNTSGSAASETGFVAGHTRTSSNTMAIYNLTGGAVEQLSTTTKAIATNTWLVSRYRKEGTTLYYREWTHGTTEPETWLMTGTMTPKADGGTGVASFGTGQVDIDWVGVNVGGGPAPMGS